MGLEFKNPKFGHQGAQVEQLLLNLIQRLEIIGDRDESLYDTVVCEKIGEPIFFLFLKPKPGYAMPDDYGMSDEDNQAIEAALADYIEVASNLAPKLGLDTFHKRLAAFQNGEVHTEQTNYYDDFFGWSNPELFDEAGNVIR